MALKCNWLKLRSLRGARPPGWQSQQHAEQPQPYVPLAEVRGYWRQRAALQVLGRSRSEAGLAAHWLDRWAPAREPVTMIWFLQKNRSLARRVRAVAVSRAQSSELNARNSIHANAVSYSWHGHQLLNNRNRPMRGASPSVVHALVRLHRHVQQPGIETRVRVLETYASRSAAEKALETRTRAHSDRPLAVITYPVGEVLF